jgi:hypothetical protein
MASACVGIQTLNMWPVSLTLSYSTHNGVNTRLGM